MADAANEQGAGAQDRGVVRTAGTVLCTIGLVSVLIIFVWNGRGTYPAFDTLEPVAATVVVGDAMIIPTRTAIERWDVVDVTYPDRDDEKDRWVFPGHGVKLDAAVLAVKPGDRIDAVASPKPEQLRWSDVPVRVIWSLRVGGRELVTYDDVVANLEAARYQSPLISLSMMGIGALLVLGSRIKVSTPPEPIKEH
ncbi:MAG: hypothetical protein ACI9QQ_000313 [Myxococcota bacterium]|jgi:hypothetical protein